MARHSLGHVEVPEGRMLGLRLDGDRYLLLVRAGGRLHALDDLCNHAGCLLSTGRLEGFLVVCRCHLMAFDVRTGELVTSPRLCEDQRRHAVEEGAGGITVDLP